MSNKYILNYLIYLVCLLFFVTIFLRKSNLNKGENRFITFVDIYSFKYIKVIKFLTYLFIFTKMIYLLIPEFRLMDLLIPPAPSALNIVYRESALKNNTIIYISSTFGALLTPFFYMYIGILILKEKKKAAIFLLLFHVYLEYLKLGYIGRNEILVTIIFIYLVSTVKKSSYQVSVSPKNLGIITMIVIVLIPFMKFYESFRLGREVSSINFQNSLISIINSETSYPRYFDLIISNQGYYPMKDFFLWLVTLPIPKRFIPIDISLINATFSEMILNVNFGESIYYIVLPSILGESLFIFGDNLFPIHAAILGITIGFIFRILSNSKVLYIYLIYLVTLSFNIGRGGSTEIMSLCINSSLMLLIWIVIMKIYLKKDKKR